MVYYYLGLFMLDISLRSVLFGFICAGILVYEVYYLGFICVEFYD